MRAVVGMLELDRFLQQGTDLLFGQPVAAHHRGAARHRVEALHDRVARRRPAVAIPQQERLDELLRADPTNVRALVYRGNARSFQLSGSEGALADWRAALEVMELPEVRENIERLERDRIAAPN